MQCEHLCWEGHTPPPDKFPGMRYEAWCLHFPAVPRTCRSQPEPCNMSDASHTIQGTSVLHGLAHKITQVHLALLTKFIINNKTFQPQQKQVFPYSKAKADLYRNVLIIITILCCFVELITASCIYQYKKFKNHYFRGIWPYWKADTGKHNFHEILLLL